MHAGEWIAEDVKVAYGGVAPKTIMAAKVQAAIKGQPWTGDTLKKALEAVAEDVNITANAPGAAAAFPALPHTRPSSMPGRRLLQCSRQNLRAFGRRFCQLAEVLAERLPLGYLSRESRQSASFHELQFCWGLRSM